MNGLRRSLAIAGMAAVALLVSFPRAQASDRPEPASAPSAADPQSRTGLGWFFGQVEPASREFGIGPTGKSDAADTAWVDRETKRPSLHPVGVKTALTVHRHEVSGRQGDKPAAFAYPHDGVGVGPAVRVMPRGGGREAPTDREFDWTPLLILGGLLVLGVGAFLLYAVRRPA